MLVVSLFDLRLFQIHFLLIYKNNWNLTLFNWNFTKGLLSFCLFKSFLTSINICVAPSTPWDGLIIIINKTFKHWMPFMVNFVISTFWRWLQEMCVHKAMSFLCWISIAMCDESCAIYIKDLPQQMWINQLRKSVKTWSLTHRARLHIQWPPKSKSASIKHLLWAFCNSLCFLLSLVRALVSRTASQWIKVRPKSIFFSSKVRLIFSLLR